MTKRRQRRIDRRAYEAYKSRTSLPPVESPERQSKVADWIGLIILSVAVSAALSVAFFEYLERGL
jgi:cytochrome c oxidase assembly factor CtaG